MNKSEYRKNLEKALSGYNTEIKDEILEDFDEFVAEEIQKGSSEEKIIKSFGTVEEIVSSIDDSYRINEIVPVFQKEKNILNICFEKKATADIMITETDENQLSYEIKDMNKLFKKSDSIMATIEEGENEVTLRLKSPGISFSANAKVYVYVPKNFSQIVIDGSIGDVVVDDIKLESLKIRAIAGDVSIANCKAQILGIDSAAGDVEIRDSILGKTAIKSVAGDIEFDNVKAENSIVESTAGDVSVDDFMGTSLFVKSFAGDVEINDVEELETLEAVSSAGDVKVDDCHIAIASIYGKCGDIKIKDSTMGELTAEGKLGDVEIDLDDIDMLNVKGSVGDVSVKCPYDIYKKKGGYFFEKNGKEIAIKIEKGIGDLKIN